MPHCLVVLDTNVVLDWLVFGNLHCVGMAQHIQAGQWRWIASPAMREELACVLCRDELRRWQPDAQRVWQYWSDYVQMVAEPPACPLRCHDPDDQKFIDLAWEQGAQWLFTRDRALLKLASGAKVNQLKILTPQSYQTG